MKENFADTSGWFNILSNRIVRSTPCLRNLNFASRLKPSLDKMHRLPTVCHSSSKFFLRLPSLLKFRFIVRGRIKQRPWCFLQAAIRNIAFPFSSLTMLVCGAAMNVPLNCLFKNNLSCNVKSGLDEIEFTMQMRKMK